MKARAPNTIVLAEISDDWSERPVTEAEYVAVELAHTDRGVALLRRANFPPELRNRKKQR